MTRRIVLGLCIVAGCDSGGADGVDAAPWIEFVTPGSAEPMPPGTAIEISLRPQGVYGATADMHVIGVPEHAVEPFAVAIVAPDGHVLANQRFLPTSLAEVLDDGTVAMTELPIVFFEDVDPAEVHGSPATLSARMETSPMATGEVDVVLEAID